jgi:ATP-dependent RNA helicase DHX8/PRP22
MLNVPKNSRWHSKLEFIKMLMSDDKLYICPDKKCGTVIYVENDDRIDLFCDMCDGKWCRLCLVSPYHNDQTCLEYELDNSNGENSVYLKKMITSGKIKICPVCRAPIFRESGCNHMSCEYCKSHWCWLCKKVGIDYSHFNSNNGSESCKGRLWENVEILV